MNGNAYAKRNPAIDRLRALTMVLMVFVNYFWTIQGVPNALAHAAPGVDYMGLSDYIFPAFLFVMGMSIPYAVESRRRKGEADGTILAHVLRRTLALLVMGVFTENDFGTLPLGPHSHSLYFILMTVGIFLLWTDIPKDHTDGAYGKSTARGIITAILRLAGTALLLGMAIVWRSPDGERFAPHWWGILGLIGWTYLFSAVVYLTASAGKWNSAILSSLAVIAVLLAVNILSTPNRSGSCFLELQKPNFYNSFLDVLQLRNAGHHLLAMGGMLLSMVSAEITSEFPKGKRLGLAAAAAAVLMGLSELAHIWFIAQKNGAYLPWILRTEAVCVLAYGLFTFFDGTKFLAGADRIFSPAGKATLTMYMIPYLWMGIAGLTGWNLWGRFSGVAGLLYCAVYTAAILGLTWVLTKINVKLKI